MEFTVLSIAGSDPTGGAGIQMDLKVMHALGVHGMAVPTALTVQDTGGVTEASGVQEGLLRRQLESLIEDIRPDAVKTGMLYSPYAVELVAEMVVRFGLKNLVVDPVAVSSSGHRLAGPGVLELIMKKLFPLASVVTPNLREAERLTGLVVKGVTDAEAAAKALMGAGPGAVVVTGGHMKKQTVDVFYDGKSFHRFSGEKAKGNFHGTGCAFSSAVASALALGHSPLQAVGEAAEFVHKAIGRSFRPGRGTSLLGI